MWVDGIVDVATRERCQWLLFERCIAQLVYLMVAITWGPVAGKSVLAAAREHGSSDASRSNPERRRRRH
jgi:hypothetical protein